MKTFTSGKLNKIKDRHTSKIHKQTGFPSPATHYAEPTIDLHKELIINKDATFFIRIDGDELSQHQIFDKDVLLIDRSLKPKENDLILVIIDGEFKVIRLSKIHLDSECILWGKISYIIHYVG